MGRLGGAYRLGVVFQSCWHGACCPRAGMGKCASSTASVLAVVFAVGCASEAPAVEARPEGGRGEAPTAGPASTSSVISRITTDRGSIALLRDADGEARLQHTTPGGLTRNVACEPLEGAWGLWVNDVDGDGRREVLVALRKRALHDPRLENRLHVYALEAGRCVPVWRGTRLAGRFEEVAVEVDAPGVLLALERVGRTKRVARYRWSDFGYALEVELWRGDGEPPARLRERFVQGAHRSEGGTR